MSSTIDNYPNSTNLLDRTQGVISSNNLHHGHMYRDNSFELKNEVAKQKLLQVKNVLKNSKTLKEQLKGVCSCYDEYVELQTFKEDQKALSLMKNFFLQIVNKSQGEIIKYKQAYEQQRERRKELETKLTTQAEENAKIVRLQGT